MTSTHSMTRNFTLLLGAAVVSAGCAASHAAPPDAPGNADIVRDGLARGVGGADTFYALLAEDVRWTVARATPRTYTSRQEFLDVAAAPIVDRLTGPIQAEVHEILADDDRVMARWRGTATARDGHPYVNEYNWVMTLEGGQVTDVVAYLDLVVLDELIERVPLPS
ncbi:nuclear transport factor 2 family protein [Mycobacterium sp. ITM-2016-00317]|uniref:nuclear transport factor 2 family protein n=1 Tax=Mycobacterium sp. ITM-2016-00317 TaxID=2099694 RepID=UPI00287FEBF0|nr:nuclear transport factor 2 family protein [Mycobacterium sp. ITM-2016-00317]WNG88809.1 nuclear transport factor 2 family protein [Mycobacterium sp. ITM-2016-00317]